jgi:hypothetical protein
VNFVRAKSAGIVPISVGASGWALGNLKKIEKKGKQHQGENSFSNPACVS